jgi:hypothetical protein
MKTADIIEFRPIYAENRPIYQKFGRYTVGIRRYIKISVDDTHKILTAAPQMRTKNPLAGAECQQVGLIIAD